MPQVLAGTMAHPRTTMDLTIALHRPQKNIKKTTFQKKVANLLKDAAKGDTESIVAAITKTVFN